METVLMAAALSKDLRWRAVRAVTGGMSIREAGRQFSASTAGRWHRQWRKIGSVTPGKQSNLGRSRLDLDPEKLAFIDEAGANTKMTRMRGYRISNNHNSAIMVLNMRCVDVASQQIAACVSQGVTFTSFNIFTGVIAADTTILVRFNGLAINNPSSWLWRVPIKNAAITQLIEVILHCRKRGKYLGNCAHWHLVVAVY